ncbi:helix-turn-helix domain-containing protein [Enterococcus sp. LJL128]
MIKTGEVLRKFRKRRGIMQNDLSVGISSRQTYSKIETNQQEPNFETLKLLLKRLDYEISDFEREVRLIDESHEFYALFLNAVNGESNLKEVTSLFSYADQRKNQSNKDFHFYMITKGHLHRKFPSVVPKFSKSDIAKFKKIVNGNIDFFNLYDLKLVADFSPQLLSYQELLNLYQRIPSFSPFDFSEDTQVYRTQIHKIYNNFCDIAAFRNDLKTAKEILAKHKHFAKIHPELRYSFFIKLNEITISYIETKDKERLEGIKFLIESMEFVEDESMKKVFEYQYYVLKNQEDYNTLDSVIYD